MHPHKPRLLLGAHTSIAGGLEQAIIRGASIGCSTIQIFTKSNRQWSVKDLTPEEIILFKETRSKYLIDPIIAHATYLINLASPDKQAREKSMQALGTEFHRSELLGLDSLVLHPGSHVSSSEQIGLDTIIESLRLVLSQHAGKTKLLLEVMAGQGSSLCYSFEQLAYVLKGVNHKNVGICFDTCHAFAAGYDFRDKQSYEHLWKTFDTIIGLEHLHAIHLNDSKKDLGSRVDRHENIGKGKIGLKAFELLFNDPRFFNIPKILETPEGTLEDYAKDMAVIKGILSEDTIKKLGTI